MAWSEDEDDGLGRAVASVEAPAPLTLPPPGAARRRSWPASLRQDIRYSARALRAAPAFSVTVLLAIALSSGPVSAVVSVVTWLSGGRTRA